MGSDLLPVALIVLLTWWVHSGLLLGTAGLISFWRPKSSPRSRDWLWKSAAVLPFLTVPVQYGLGTSLLWRFEVGPIREAVTRPPSDPAIDSPENLLPFAPKFSAKAPSLPKSSNQVIEEPQSPAIAEKPASDPLRIESIVSDVSSPQAASNFEWPLSIENTSPAGAFPVPADIKTPKPTASIPKQSLGSQGEGEHHRARWPWFVPGVLGVVLALGWAGGVRFLWLLISTSRLVGRSRRLTSGMASEELKRLLGEFQMRGTIHLAESAECSVPAAGGVFRRVILLPLRMEDRLNREEIRALLAHELGHHARGDVWWLWLGRGLCHLLPIQPLYFWAVREWHRAAEPLCDDWAIERNVSPIVLAKTLTQVAGWRFASPAIGPAAANGSSDLTYRVERLLNRNPAAPPWQRRLMCLLIPLWAGATLVLAPLVSWSQAETSPAATVSSPKFPAPTSNAPERLGPMPVEPKQAMPPLALENPPRIPDDIRQDLDAIGKDLELALALLNASEDDPQIREAISQLKARLQRIRIMQLQSTNAPRVPSP